MRTTRRRWTPQARTLMLQTLLAGVITLDAALQARVNTLRDQREGILAELALAKREKPSARQVSPKQVADACERLRTMLLDPNRGYGKQLLRLLVTEIRVGIGTVEMTGPTATLSAAVAEMKMGTSLEEVPSFVSTWRARQDSNPRPPGS
jgi:site-specific DNA recombinase